MSGSFTGYRATFREYLRVLAKPNLTHDMLQFEQPDWRLHFQAWNTLYVWTMFLKGVVVVILPCIAVVGSLGVVGSFGVVGYVVLSFALNFFLYTVLATHLAWFVVWKSFGCCGKTGYVVLAVIYLAMAFTHVSFLGKTSFSVAAIFDLLHGLLAFPVLICSIFVSLACFKLFEGVPGESQPLMRPDEAGEPLQEVTVSGSTLEESPDEALQESATPFHLLPAEPPQKAVEAPLPAAAPPSESNVFPGNPFSYTSSTCPSGSAEDTAVPESPSASQPSASESPQANEKRQKPAKIEAQKY